MLASRVSQILCSNPHCFFLVNVISAVWETFLFTLPFLGTLIFISDKVRGLVISSMKGFYMKTSFLYFYFWHSYLITTYSSWLYSLHNLPISIPLSFKFNYFSLYFLYVLWCEYQDMNFQHFQQGRKIGKERNGIKRDKLFVGT